jgi:hypothetical protein
MDPETGLGSITVSENGACCSNARFSLSLRNVGDEQDSRFRRTP